MKKITVDYENITKVQNKILKDVVGEFKGSGILLEEILLALDVVGFILRIEMLRKKGYTVKKKT